MASALAAIGGLAPIVFAGISSRIGGAIVPFWIAAILFGVSGMYRGQFKPLAIGVYFIGGLSTVYAILQLASLPLRLTLIGSCPPAPARCLPGFERAMTEGEQTAIWFGVGIGLVAIFVGYFGLFNLVRRPVATGTPAPPTGMPPPVRTIPPVEDAPARESQPEDPPATTSKE